MLIRFFKASQPSVIIMLAVLSLLLRFLAVYTYWGQAIPGVETWEVIQPFFGFVNEHVWLSFILAWLSTIGIGVLLNYVFTKNDLFPRSTLLLSFISVTLLSALPETTFFSAGYLLLILVILLLNKAFQLSKSNNADSGLFDMGFLIGLATLIYFPSIIFLILTQVAIAYFSRFSLRSLLITLAGVASVAILVFGLDYFTGKENPIGSDLKTNLDMLSDWTRREVIYLITVLSAMVATYVGFTKQLRNTVRIKRSYFLGAMYLILTLVNYVFFDRIYGAILIIPGISIWMFGFFYDEYKPWLKDVFWVILLSVFLFML